MSKSGVIDLYNIIEIYNKSIKELEEEIIIELYKIPHFSKVTIDNYSEALMEYSDIINMKLLPFRNMIKRINTNLDEINHYIELVNSFVMKLEDKHDDS